MHKGASLLPADTKTIQYHGIKPYNKFSNKSHFTQDVALTKR